MAKGKCKTKPKNNLFRERLIEAALHALVLKSPFVANVDLVDERFFTIGEGAVEYADATLKAMEERDGKK